MNIYSTFKKIIGVFSYARIKVAIDWIRNPPAITPSCISATLDYDDVLLAKKLLRKKEKWIDPAIENQFADNFSQWNGSKYAFAFMGGRVALSACIQALDLKPGDEVILPGYTCVVVPNAFEFSGIKIIYSDIELDTYGLDADLLENKITPKTKAILLQHLYGLVCRDYEKIVTLARENNLYVIEDCAHGTGVMFKNRKIGNLGDVAFYSLEQSKAFNTIQGGLAITNNDSFAQRLQEFYNKAPYPSNERIDKQLYNVIIHFYAYKYSKRRWTEKLYNYWYKEKMYESTTETEIKGIKPEDYGCKMPAAIARIGLNQLNKIDKYNQIRRKNAKYWDTWCDSHGYKRAFVLPESIPIYLRYPVIVEQEKKQDISWGYKELGLELGVWFTSNIHPSKRVVRGCPNADKAVRQCINFPTLLDRGVQ